MTDDRLPDVDLAEVLRHVRGLATVAATAGRDEEAAWWNAQARRWAIDPTVARTMQLVREFELLDRVDPATVEAFARRCLTADREQRDLDYRVARRIRYLRHTG